MLKRKKPDSNCVSLSSFVTINDKTIQVKDLIDKYGLFTVSNGNHQDGDYVPLEKSVFIGPKASPAYSFYAIRIGDQSDHWNQDLQQSYIRRYSVSWFPKEAFPAETFKFHLSSVSASAFISTNGTPIGLVNEIEWAMTIPCDFNHKYSKEKDRLKDQHVL